MKKDERASKGAPASFGGKSGICVRREGKWDQEARLDFTLKRWKRAEGGRQQLDRRQVGDAFRMSQ